MSNNLTPAEFFERQHLPLFDAAFSPCRRYRYALVRRWNARPMGLVLGINPSTAGVTTEDATTRKLEGFACRWGWGGYWLMNPFAFRSTDQRGLLLESDPIGPDNDAWLAEAITKPVSIVVAWGSAKTAAVRKLLDARLAAMAAMFDGRELLCLGTSKDGSPCHPLMLAYSTPLVRWEAVR